MIHIQNLLTDHLQLGIITAENINISQPHPVLEDRLTETLELRRELLTDEEDLFRNTCRDMMRIGSYKPTGRGKPASEYLLRVAEEGQFPRINSAADINNYISLKYLTPISLWDTDKIASDSWVFRTGREGEAFVFNSSGQTISLTDLVTGFAVSERGEIPIVTPVKDCQQTKTDKSTRNLAAAIYYPADWEAAPPLNLIIDEYAKLLGFISDNVEKQIT